MKVIPETRCVPKFDIYVLIIHVIPNFAQIKHTFIRGQWLGRRGGGAISYLPSYWIVVPNNFSFITIRWVDVLTMNINSAFV